MGRDKAHGNKHFGTSNIFWPNPRQKNFKASSNFSLIIKERDDILTATK
jgi:hypothetical protein